MKQKDVGKIYKTKVRKVSGNWFEFALITVIEPKKYMVTKYDLKLCPSECKKDNNNSKPKVELSKSHHPSCKLNNITKSSDEPVKQNLLDSGNLVFPFEQDDLIEIASLEPCYIESALPIIEEQVVKPYYGETIVNLSNSIYHALVGPLMTGNQLKSALNLKQKVKGKNINLAKLLSKITSCLCENSNYKIAPENVRFEFRYISTLRKMFESCGMDPTRFNTVADYSVELAKRPMLVYEYLLQLSEEEIYTFVDEMVSLYTDLSSFCITNGVGNKMMWQKLDDELKALANALGAYEQGAVRVIIEGGSLIIMRADACDSPMFSEYGLSQTISKPRILTALKNIAKKIPNRLFPPQNGLKKRRRRKND